VGNSVEKDANQNAFNLCFTEAICFEWPQKLLVAHARKQGALLGPRTARQPEELKSGSLTSKTAQGFLIALVAEVVNRGFTGRLQVRSRRIVRRLFFMQGKVVGFWSDHPEDAFGRRFVDAGLLDSKSLRWTQDHLAPGERIEEALVAGATVNWEQVTVEQVRQLEFGVDTLTRMNSGEWELKEQADLERRLHHSPMPEAGTFPAIWRGVRKSVSADHAVQALSEGGGAFRCADSLSEILSSLPAVPEGLASALRKGSTLEQVFERVRDPSGELFQLIWFLESVGAVSRLGGVGSGPIAEPSTEPVHLEKGEEVPVSDWKEKDVPENHGMSVTRADDLMKIGAYAAALSFLEDARFAEPNNPNVLAALGWAHFQATGGEEFEEAESFVDLALTFDSKHVKGLEYRGRIALEKGDTDKARIAVERLVQIDPKNRWAKAQIRQLGTGKEAKRGFGFWRRK
jgi:tetratricopeptide (TPR) repeat protein